MNDNYIINIYCKSTIGWLVG